MPLRYLHRRTASANETLPSPLRSPYRRTGGSTLETALVVVVVPVTDPVVVVVVVVDAVPVGVVVVSSVAVVVVVASVVVVVSSVEIVVYYE